MPAHDHSTFAPTSTVNFQVRPTGLAPTSTSAPMMGSIGLSGAFQQAPDAHIHSAPTPMSGVFQQGPAVHVQPPQTPIADRLAQQGTAFGGNHGATHEVLQVREKIPDKAKDLMARLEAGQVDGHLIVRKPSGDLVNFSEVRPRIKVYPKSVSSYAGAVVNAIWGKKVLAERKLGFDIVKGGDDISERMPESQLTILHKVLYHEQRVFFDDVMKKQGVADGDKTKQAAIIRGELAKLTASVDQSLRDTRRDRVSLKSLSLERKLELVAGDEEFLESFVLGNATALQAVAARSAGVRDLLTQALDHS